MPWYAGSVKQEPIALPLWTRQKHKMVGFLWSHFSVNKFQLSFFVKMILILWICFATRSLRKYVCIRLVLTYGVDIFLWFHAVKILALVTISRQNCVIRHRSIFCHFKVWLNWFHVCFDFSSPVQLVIVMDFVLICWSQPNKWVSDKSHFEWFIVDL